MKKISSWFQPLDAGGLPQRDRSWTPRPWLEAGWVVLGSLLIALGFNLLLRPNGISPGGLPGLSLVVHKVFGVEPALTQVLFNLLVLGFAWLVLGRRFALQSLLGSLAMPAFVWLTRDLPVLTHDLFLASVTGAAVAGVGLGLVFRGNGSVGGFSTLAIMALRKLGWQLHRAIWLLDGLVLLVVAAIFPPERLLCSAVAVVLIGRTVRAVLTGFDTATFALIVSTKTEEVRAVVLGDLDLGLTVLPARGGYTGEERDVLLVVMRADDVPRLKARVRAIDPAAFLVLSSSSEVLGHGFKSHV